MGGAEHVVVNLADALVARGHQVKIAYLTGEALVLPKSASIEVISIGMQGSKDFCKAYFKLRRVVKNFKPDVVHGHMIHANLLSRLLRLTISIPKLVCTSHSNNEGGALRILSYRLTDRLADISTNVSQDAVDEFVKKGAVKAGRMVAVVNGIDINRFVFNTNSRTALRHQLNLESKKMLLAVGRLDKPKDYPNLLNAIAQLVNTRKDFKVFIAGDGPLKSELLSLVKRLEITDFVEFLGVRRDIPELMSAADFFVLPSAWEGFGLVVAEAMACKRVVVATDCGGVKEVVGSNGFLVEPKNNDLLAQALNEALNLSNAECAEIGAGARQRIMDHFSLDANVEKYLKIYTA